VTQPSPIAPPRGPGARPPFVAAPDEGSTARVWWAVGTAALALLLCGGGGLAVFIGMIVTGVRAVQDQTHVTVTKYIQTLESGDIGAAYDLQCDAFKKRYDIDQFRNLEHDTATSTGFTVGDLDITTLSVPVELKFRDGRTDEVVYQLSQDSETGHFQVCGTA
jgi:hypothetical protein